MSGFGTDTGRARRPPSRVFSSSLSPWCASRGASAEAAVPAHLLRRRVAIPTRSTRLERRGVSRPTQRSHRACPRFHLQGAAGNIRDQLRRPVFRSPSPRRSFSSARILCSSCCAPGSVTGRRFWGPSWSFSWARPGWTCFFTFQIAFFGSMAAGLGALLALDRDDRAGDRVACLLRRLHRVLGNGNHVRGGRPGQRRAREASPRASSLRGAGADSSLRSLVRRLGSPVHQQGHLPRPSCTQPGYVFDIASQAIAALLGLATPLTGDGRRPGGAPLGPGSAGYRDVLSIWRLRRIGGPSRGLWRPPWPSV